MILCLPLYKAMVVCSLAASRKDASLSLCLSSVSASVLLQALDFFFLNGSEESRGDARVSVDQHFRLMYYITVKLQG